MIDGMRRIELIGAAIGEGAPDGRTRGGPGSLRRWGLGGRLSARGRAVGWGPQVESDPSLRAQGAMAVVAEFSVRLAAAVAGSIRGERMPVVIGGDHSCAIGTWSGAAAALRDADPGARLGLVWIDAHLDAHTPETSETQRPHGMPLAALLGHGPPALTAVGGPAPKLRPEDVVLIGPRSWESGEAALLERLGVRVIDAAEVGRRGFADCVREAVERVSAATAGWGASFDLDVLDPEDAPGTGVRVAHGLRTEELALALHGLARDARMVAAELVEYNPVLDVDRATARAADRVLGALLDRRELDAPASGPGLERRGGARARP